jgi:bud site selection protein 20
MGTGHTASKKRATAKNKQYKRKVWLCNRDKDVDQIQDEFEKVVDAQTIDGLNIDQTPSEVIATSIPFTDDLPGCGQFYCPETSRHFIDARALADHKKTKFYKRRLKQLKQEKYTQHTSEWASGMTKEVLPSIKAIAASDTSSTK